MSARFIVLLAACWFSAFAFFHLIQAFVLNVPPDLQMAITEAWAIGSTFFAPVMALIIHRKRPA